MKRAQGLRAYAVRRLLLLVPLVFLISVVVFLLVHMVPGGPVAALIGEHATNTATVDAIKARYHLNASLPSQYGAWVTQVFHGNLGTSIFTSQSVGSEIRQRLPVSVVLNVIGLTLALLIGVPLGSLAAARRGEGSIVWQSALPSFCRALLTS